MSDVTLGGGEYRKNEDISSKTNGISTIPPQKGEGGSPLLPLVNGIVGLPLPRLVLILLFVSYNVMLFSKGKDGISFEDIFWFFTFVFTSIAVFVLLVLLKLYWSDSENRKRLIGSIKNFVDQK